MVQIKNCPESLYPICWVVCPAFLIDRCLVTFPAGSVWHDVRGSSVAAVCTLCQQQLGQCRRTTVCAGGLFWKEQRTGQCIVLYIFRLLDSMRDKTLLQITSWFVHSAFCVMDWFRYSYIQRAWEHVFQVHPIRVYFCLSLLSSHLCFCQLYVLHLHHSTVRIFCMCPLNAAEQGVLVIVPTPPTL